MITADPDGSGLHVLDPYGKTSHYDWRDPRHILAWAYHPSHGDKFYLYEDRTDRVEVVAPRRDDRERPLHVPAGRTMDPQRHLPGPADGNSTRTSTTSSAGTRHPLGHFRSPPEYTGEWRCDTHPRSSPDGRSVVIDSPHGGQGRQLYLIDVSGLVGAS